MVIQGRQNGSNTAITVFCVAPESKAASFISISRYMPTSFARTQPGNATGFRQLLCGESLTQACQGTKDKAAVRANISFRRPEAIADGNLHASESPVERCSRVDRLRGRRIIRIDVNDDCVATTPTLAKQKTLSAYYKVRKPLYRKRGQRGQR